MSPVPPERQTYRVYVDTSVFTACEDEKFQVRESSKRLFERFRAGDMTLVLSALVADELNSATVAARALPNTVPREHTEVLAPSAAAEELADRYIDAGAVNAAARPAALHVAFATLADVDTLASWDYRHLLNFRPRPRFNAVNRELGHPQNEMHEPPAILGETFRDPNSKGFDCVAFQRQQRDRISRKLNAMTPEERVDWLRNVEITDPILRRVMERSRRVKLNKLVGPTSAPDRDRK